VPLITKFWTPVVPLDGLTEPVRFAVGALTTNVTGDPEFVTDPFCPLRTMFEYVPGVALPVVLTMNVALADPPLGTLTVVGDHDPLAPGNDQFNAVGVTAPANPPTLVNVAL
jgi:hypothetical protein